MIPPHYNSLKGFITFGMKPNATVQPAKLSMDEGISCPAAKFTFYSPLIQWARTNPLLEKMQGNF